MKKSIFTILGLFILSTSVFALNPGDVAITHTGGMNVYVKICGVQNPSKCTVPDVYLSKGWEYIWTSGALGSFNGQEIQIYVKTSLGWQPAQGNCNRFTYRLIDGVNLNMHIKDFVFWHTAYVDRA